MRELKRYFSYMGKYKYSYWLILSITIFSSAMLGVLNSYMNKLFFNAVEYGDGEKFRLAAMLCVILLVLNCLFPYLRYFAIRLVRKLVFDIKIRLFSKLMSLNVKYYEEHHSGEALKTLNWDANSLKDSYFSHVYWVAGKLVNGVVAIITMLFYSPLLALISIGFSLVTVYMSVEMNKQIKRMDKKIQGSMGRLAERLSDILSGFTLLKMYRGSFLVVEHFEQENQEVTGKETKRVHKTAMLEMLSFLLGILGNFGTIIAGAIFVAKGRLDYGTVMAVVSLQMNVSSMVQRLGSSMTTLSASLVKAGRVFDFLELDCEEELQETRDDMTESVKTGNDRASQNVHTGLCIEINKLSFSYNKEHKVLNNLSLTISSNEKVLLLGESGCGKSTLLKLLLRFYNQSSGEIRLYGRDIREYSLEQIRQMITYLPQDNYLFEGTIRENIACGNPKPASVTEEEIRRAAEHAYADEFIRELPLGYDTELWAGGSNLSGGQRQRLAIARAFMKDAPIILMDEPSAALDVESEKQIEQAIKALMKERIVLMITHRETAFSEFDRKLWLGVE